MNSGIYTYAIILDRKFFPGNIHNIIVDKLEEIKLDDKLQIIFNYFWVYEKLYKIYMQFINVYHYYFSNLRYECCMVADLKYIYLIILVYLKVCKYFIFIILKIGQFQSIHIKQESMIAKFTISELIYTVLSSILELEAFKKDSEPFLI